MRHSHARLLAVIFKEFIQMWRDKVTFSMILALPIMQLMLFGFAINTNPRHLPTAIVNDDHSVFTRSILKTMENSTYFQFINAGVSQAEAKKLLKQGDVQFVVNFPNNFSKDLVRGLNPVVLLDADATDPAATSRAVAVFNELASVALKPVLTGVLRPLNAHSPPYISYVYTRYNPLAITAYNIVPGLLGVVLTMTMVIITASAITREYERGTMENLLAMPLRPVEIIIGKIVPYIIVGYLQVVMILLMAKFIFSVPMIGSIILLLILSLPFIAANLAVGLTFSTLASNQLQATQSSFFFFLPSLLLSGFMFPFRGMPNWAQILGNFFPLKHYLIIVRGILLKGNGIIEVWPEVMAILLFTFVMMVISIKRYRKTLD